MISDVLTAAVGWLIGNPIAAAPAAGVWVAAIAWGRRLQATGQVAGGLSGFALVFAALIYVAKNWPTAWRLIRMALLALSVLGWLLIWMLVPSIRGQLLFPVAVGAFFWGLFALGSAVNWEAPTLTNLRVALYRSRVSRMLSEAMATFAPGDDRLPVTLGADGAARLEAHVQMHPGDSVYDFRDREHDGTIAGAVNRTAERYKLPADWQLAHVSPSDTAGHADLILARESTLLEKRDWSGPTKKGPIVFGWDAAERPVSVPLIGSNDSDDDGTHLGVGGLTRSGKSVTLRTILAELAYREHVALVLGDPKRSEFRIWDERASSIALGADACREQVDDLYKLMVRRMEALEDDTGYASSAKRSAEFPKVVYILDEIAEISKGREGTQVKKSLHSMLTLGAGLGVHLVWATQRPSGNVIETDFRDNTPFRIAHAMVDGTSTEMILGNHRAKAHEIPINQKGVGFASRDDDRAHMKFRSHFLSPERGRMVAAETADLRVELAGIKRRYRTALLDCPEEEE